jgi:hypothetical protein
VSISLIVFGWVGWRRALVRTPLRRPLSARPHTENSGTNGQARILVSVVSRQAWLRWATVACGTAALCALPVIAGALPVPDSPISATALRTRILASGDVPYQGYAESTLDFGVPHLPDLSGVSMLLDGTTDQYAWYRSAAHWRAEVSTPAGEDDIYQVGSATYLWDYSRNLLTRIVGSQTVRLPRAADLLPPALSRRLLELAAGSARISRLPSRRIAGIDTAGLQVRTADPRTTVAAVDIWADPATGLPVTVQVFARGTGRPVVTSSFLQLSESRPALSVVTPNPAPGIGVTTAEFPAVAQILYGIGPPLPGQLAGFVRNNIRSGVAPIGAYGTGFSRFAVVPLPGRDGSQAQSAALAAGANLIEFQDGTAAEIRTPLLTVVLASSQFGGPVFLLAGPVTAAVLERAASAVMARSVVLP